ncbi:hypothetical protein HOP50_06g45530 [Chloropicon primus]|uniref:Uncharacterized protein n=1 Tax=Chloropicon primus TaxID=1764295 RepID=A0A5B8MRW2_9CHLO|nr:hypothetical protein A3770_06p45300 [Chloropicon primus]UPR01232.1 hypothetical protein HOP50_06g45530 [Chloropicon primus]|mmetsp:Transcript_13146/g.36954  ORF Transcript_13146/g.36954 Transcript_13146/m.36954 type:complete len:86 (-) Transcript_13146:1778-2035(-)|eukprot:QDZ22012.1 hypothetical protein A3770_06p45300 [Chloropicon primus]
MGGEGEGPKLPKLDLTKVEKGGACGSPPAPGSEAPLVVTARERDEAVERLREAGFFQPKRGEGEEARSSLDEKELAKLHSLMMSE